MGALVVLLAGAACAPSDAPSNDSGRGGPTQDAAARRGGPPSAADRAADSAAVVASRYAALRDSLNREAAALASLDRGSTGYAARYDAHRGRLVLADSLRAHRDRLRARADSLGQLRSR